MSPLILLSFLASLLLCCLCFPSVWSSITGGDEFLDAHEAGLAVVASRESLHHPPPRGSVPTAVRSLCVLSSLDIGTPFRESGPPACMAKLIMLRHKIQQDNTKRRNSMNHARRAARTFNVSPARTSRNVPWVRFGRAYGKQNY
ncbi:hypothetical protein C8Q70DRAFT_1052726 [Cubamyces menziesii]|nr:hypothetical protein C8Q70DRAFT_1052726 [Cubamyces menziesii]